MVNRIFAGEKLKTVRKIRPGCKDQESQLEKKEHKKGQHDVALK